MENILSEAVKLSCGVPERSVCLKFLKYLISDKCRIPDHSIIVCDIIVSDYTVYQIKMTN